MTEPRIAFIGSGHIAQYHAYALEALPFYYPGVPELHRIAVASPTKAHREHFARRYGFEAALTIPELFRRSDFDTLFILSPNSYHFEQLERALESPHLNHIYVEKPLCATEQERNSIAHRLLSQSHTRIVQLGFQFLQMSSARRAHSMWQRGAFGQPVHFRASYLHSGYLSYSYRKCRPNRLAATPAGGAIADLGSHLFSLLASFFGDGLEVLDARHSRGFDDVDPMSDLCSVVLLRDKSSGAVGTVIASRISAGAGECLELDVRCTEGGFMLTTERPDMLEVYCASDSDRRVLNCASDYRPESEFPALHASPGWLRSLVHANYMFLCGGSGTPSDLAHGLMAQRLVCDTARCLHRNGGQHV